MTPVAWSSRINHTNENEPESTYSRQVSQSANNDEALLFIERQRQQIELEGQKLEVEKQKLELEKQRLAQEQLQQQQATDKQNTITFGKLAGTGLQVLGGKLSGSENPESPSKWVPVRDGFLRQWGFKK